MSLLINNNGFSWFTTEKIKAKGYLFADSALYSQSDILKYFSDIKNKADFVQKLQIANGSFAVVLEIDGIIYAAVDKLRSIPLFFNVQTGQICDSIPLGIDQPLNSDAVDSFLLTGYTVGNSTLLDTYSQVQAGEYIVREEGATQRAFYYRHFQPTQKLAIANYYKPLAEVSQRVFERLVESCRDRTIIVPLSGGYDSRYIVGMLKKIGYKNVLCYTYGRESSFEVEISKHVATQLGFPWHFVNYSEEKWHTYLNDKKWEDYAFNYSSLPHCQEYLALKELTEKHILPRDGIIVPGFCGDLLGGSYLPQEIASDSFNELSQVELSQYILRSHFNLDNEAKNLGTLYEAIRDDIQVAFAASENDFISRNEEFFTRHKVAKFVVNSLRVYEYFGYEWRMPLWDDELTNFWYQIDYHKKIGKQLYDNFLFDFIFKEQNIAFKKGGANSVKKRLERHKTLHRLANAFYPQLSFVWRRFFKPRKYEDFNSFDVLYDILAQDVLRQGVNKLPSKHNINSIYSYWLIQRLKQKQSGLQIKT
ncbi:asparagine synthase C-terminal domain-containing protein [Pigmentiphaga sp. D-2]|uniref:asparagine synthase C-terminal domain-containing protein n=1 Tax=Pigmentiphaga sp. D-2 TaxID=1002116 RepID=UPI0014045AC7|nr:asparagine synthase C-terminal domain-containing protein [Pigmentiphaga sp. D-2]